MAMYKVPQDVEADDKFFGPLSFKQFIFGGVSLTLGYAIFYTISNNIWPIALVLLPFFAGFTALAFPWSKDQPTEIWLASRIRFFLVPHKRIWNQTGMKDLVAITVPKREVHIYTDGLSQDQVRSRFTALASVVDSRGWAVKTALSPAAVGGTSVAPQQIAPSDRLVEARVDSSFVERSKMVESTQDIMDDQKNPIAQQFSSLIEQSTEKHKQDTLAKIQQARHNSEVQSSSSSTGPMLPPIPADPSTSKTPTAQPPQDWLSKTTPPADPQLTSFQDSAVIAPGADGSSIPSAGPAIATIGKADEQQLLEHVKRKKQRDKDIRSRSHVKVIKTPEEIEAEKREAEEKALAEAAEQARLEEEARARELASTPPTDPVILSLADNNDLNVETLSRQAKKDKDKLDDDTDVVISLR